VIVGTHTGDTGVCRARACEFLNVQMHQAGRDIQAGDTYRLQGFGSRNLGCDCGDPAIFDGDVAPAVNVVLESMT
jgi:hypothetical protein